MKGYSLTNEERAYGEALDELIRALQKAVKTSADVYEAYYSRVDKTDLQRLSAILDTVSAMRNIVYTQNYKKEKQ